MSISGGNLNVDFALDKNVQYANLKCSTFKFYIACWWFEFAMVLYVVSAIMINHKTKHMLDNHNSP